MKSKVVKSRAELMVGWWSGLDASDVSTWLSTGGLSAMQELVIFVYIMFLYLVIYLLVFGLYKIYLFIFLVIYS